MDYFEFKRFRVYHDKCAMKVGTDGVLLGAWADVEGCRRILDIGCGSALVALMVAQRVEDAQVVGVEIDVPAARQAAENCAASPFADRLSVVCTDIANYEDDDKFDCILSNPPFFEESLLPPDARRAAARHTQGLTGKCLIAHAKRLMRPGALFHVVLPSISKEAFVGQCALQGLSLRKQTEVVTREGKTPKRVLLSFVNDVAPQRPLRDTLVLLDRYSNDRSEAYATLTKDFYL